MKKSLLCASVTEDYLKMVSQLSEDLHTKVNGKVVPNVDATLFALGFQYDNRSKVAKFKLLTTLQDTRAENVFFRKLYENNKDFLQKKDYDYKDKLTSSEVREFRLRLTSEVEQFRKCGINGDKLSQKVADDFDEQFLMYVRHPKFPYLVKPCKVYQGIIRQDYMHKGMYNKGGGFEGNSFGCNPFTYVNTDLVDGWVEINHDVHGVGCEKIYSTGGNYQTKHAEDNRVMSPEQNYDEE